MVFNFDSRKDVFFGLSLDKPVRSMMSLFGVDKSKPSILNKPKVKNISHDF